MKKRKPVYKNVTTIDDVLRKDDKLIITMGSPYKGILFSSRMRIWLRNRSGSYRQVGLIQKLNLSASVNGFFPKLSMTMPEAYKGGSSALQKTLARNKKELRSMGVNIIEKKFKKLGNRR